MQFLFEFVGFFVFCYFSAFVAEFTQKKFFFCIEFVFARHIIPAFTNRAGET